MDHKRRVGVVADDITGSNDIGVMLAKNGYRAGVFSMHTHPTLADFEGLDAIVLNTDSRLDDAATAAAKTDEACRLLMQLPCGMYHSKTCSVFRGNIGAQFDAMQRALGIHCSMVVLGFPANGRTTVDGVHSVYGTKLSESMFRNDPIHPMTESNLVTILQGQTNGTVKLFDHTLLDLPEAARAMALEGMKADCNYVIFDVRDQSDLQTSAALIQDEVSICGSSAICEELPRIWAHGAPVEDGVAALLHPVDDPCGVLVVSGSLTEPTRRQVAHLIDAGAFVHEIPTWTLLEDTSREVATQAAVDAVSARIAAGGDAVLLASQSPEAVARTVEAGAALGLDRTAVGRLISDTLRAAVHGIWSKTGLKKAVVAGGETSAAVSDALGIHKMVILREIEPGVPAMYGYDEDGRETLLVFKSGSFGSDAFLSKSVDSLRRLEKGTL